METSFIFSSDNLELKSEGEKFFVEGYISTSDLDLVNDIVTKTCLIDMADQMKKRSIKFDVEHESFRGKSNLDREINKTIIPAAKIDDFLMDKKGLKVRAVLNNHSARFDEVKGSIQDGFLDAFSIAYVPVKTTVQEKNGQQVRLLDKINLLNVAFTGNPVNTESRMTNVFAKSLEFLKEQEDNNHSSDTIKLREVKQMSEEENKETTETPEESAPAEEAESTEPESTEEIKDGETQPEESDEDKEEKEDTEVKSLRAEVKALTEKVDVME
ncbi:MAG: HK97 family phage prohead protease, partial [Candidatus Heimdallarchaeaceae archaeon]